MDSEQAVVTRLRALKRPNIVKMLTIQSPLNADEVS
jgi:hypothetical protein